MTETFVLIPGAWHGGWTWRPVAERLRAHGHRVLTPTLPGLADGEDPRGYSLADAGDFVVDLIARYDLRDVTLIGHSWAGYVITHAAPRLADRLRGLVYWSAFVPAEGRGLFDEVPPDHRELFTRTARESGDNTVVLPYEVWREKFIQDAPEPVRHLTYQLLVRQPFQYFTETVTPLDPDSLSVPVSYVLSTDDIVMPPGELAWDRFADRLGVSPTAAPGSHEACFTQPDGLAEALLATVSAQH
ncbi:alpha/beta fold hydrolase [Pseudonocardia spinosispora]|uniref:alpha/beta fold hydrolase n=1 Tax=Pseudonocardia spinosispora TaxID=103441 RepID=UPI00040233B8|nr:alpha/beta hydrolase [Pseudonocardia spinosispora]